MKSLTGRKAGRMVTGKKHSVLYGWSHFGKEENEKMNIQKLMGLLLVVKRNMAFYILISANLFFSHFAMNRCSFIIIIHL